MIRIGMGTTSVLPRRLHDAFRLAAEAGYDGVEIMVTSDRDTYDPRVIGALSERFGMPVLSIHAPVLFFSTFVFGRNPRVKLERSLALAREVGAATVVVHPPYRWQRRTAAGFVGTVRELQAATGVTIAVENMFPLRVRGRDRHPYAPHWNPGSLDVAALTLDFSHAALAGVSALDLAGQWGDRLRHVHLCDGSSTEPSARVLDEHLVPGRGAQPVGEVLALLARRGFDGALIAEINSRACGSDDARRLAWLRESLEFARRHTALDRGHDGAVDAAAHRTANRDVAERQRAS
ncbi:sugar phosphate isomerase/epimerase family protein [Microcella sp.]|uniref:sugar phosphate isomerase/epimerase family protein n=1 Tax=Microcella sp. TaxID=1913979 RepID=UPI00391DD213